VEAFPVSDAARGRTHPRVNVATLKRLHQPPPASTRPKKKARWERSVFGALHATSAAFTAGHAGSGGCRWIDLAEQYAIDEVFDAVVALA